MRIDVFTIFPELIDGFTSQALLGKAQDRGLLDLRSHDLRAQTTDVHRTVDDSPFGGGAGMVLMAEPVFAAVEAVDPPRPLYLMGPGGRTLDQTFARELAQGSGFSLLCGRYEGVDARAVDHLCDGEISIGDYVLAGGEVAALVVIEDSTHPAPHFGSGVVADALTAVGVVKPPPTPACAAMAVMAVTLANTHPAPLAGAGMVEVAATVAVVGLAVQTGAGTVEVAATAAGVAVPPVATVSSLHVGVGTVEVAATVSASVSASVFFNHATKKGRSYWFIRVS